MREWRKLYRSVTSSAKLGQVSDSAGLLYMLLLPCQDDAGEIPWDRSMLRAITATRDWSWSLIEQYGHELCVSGLVSISEGRLTIARGAELNGPPTSGTPNHKTPRYYPRTSPGGTPYVSSTDAVRTEYVPSTYPVSPRGEEKRGEKSTPLVSPLPGGNLSPALENLIPSEQRASGLSTPSEKLIAEELEEVRRTQGTSAPKATSTAPAPRPNKSATAPTLTAAQRDKLVAKWSGVLDGVGDRIDAALNHVAVRKAINTERYVDNWLRNDGNKVPPTMAMLRGAASLSPVSNGHGSTLPPLDPDDPDWVEKSNERERQRQAARYSTGGG